MDISREEKIKNIKDQTVSLTLNITILSLTLLFNSTASPFILTFSNVMFCILVRNDYFTKYNLGLYFAEKLKGAVALQTYRIAGGEDHKQKAVQHLENVLHF